MTEVETVVLRPHHASNIKTDVPNETVRRVFTKTGYHQEVIKAWINLKDRIIRGEVAIVQGEIGLPDLICQLCFNLGAPHNGCKNWDKEFQKRLDTTE